MSRIQTPGLPSRTAINSFLRALGALGLIATALGVGAYLLKSGGGPAAVIETAAGPAAQPPSGASPLGDSYRMIIEEIDVDAPVRTYGLDENAIPMVPTGENAADIVAWYDFSAQPATGSNAVFAGHVTWNGSAVFKKLESLEIGDTVRLRGGNAIEAIYRITARRTFEANDPTALDVMKPTAMDTVTLITCGGAFYDTDDPVFGGAYSQRIVVQGELVSLT